MNRDDYISLDDAAKLLGVVRGTMHYYLRTLDIKTQKFPLDRRAYILKTDFQIIQKLRREARNNASEEEDVVQPPLYGAAVA